MTSHAEFFVPGIPIPQGSMRAFNNNIVHVKGKELKMWRGLIASMAHHHIHKPIEGPVSLDMTFVLPRPKSVKREFPHVKPDLDKLARAVLDAMTGIAYADDSQVIELFARKMYNLGGWSGVQIQLGHSHMMMPAASQEWGER